MLSPNHGRRPLLFIAPRAKLAVTPSLGKTRVDRTPDLSVRSPDDSHVSPAFNGHHPISTVISRPDAVASTDRTLDPQHLVIYSKLPSMTGRVRSNTIGRSTSVQSLSSFTAPTDNRTRHYIQRLVTSRASVRSLDRRCTLSATTDRTLTLSVRSLRDQSPVHSVRPCLFCIGRWWHHRTIYTLQADTPPMEFEPLPPFLRRVDPHQLQLHLLCKCANTTMCMCVSIFTNLFQRISHSTCHATQS